jgi:hypothetical protein
MTALNGLFVRAFDVLLAPLAGLPPLPGLALVSAVTAIALLLAFKATSDQRRLTRVKRSIHAGFFEIRLFADDVPTLLRTQLEMLRHSLTYLRLSLVPALWVILPLALIVSHLEFYFGYDGTVPGRAVLVKAALRGDAESDATPLTLEAPSAIGVDTPAVWFPAAREVLWRITPKMEGEYSLEVHLGDQVFSKTLRVSNRVGRRSPLRLAGGMWDQVLYPSEDPLPDDGVLKAISVQYAPRAIRILGWDTSWLVAYVALTMAFMLALRRPFGVVL